MRDVIDKVGSDYVGSYFDVGNVLYCGYPEHWIKILGKRIKKVHFKDYRRAVGSLDGFVDLLAGDVDYVAVKKALDSVGYDGWVSAEMIPPYKQYSETIIYNTSNAMDRILGRK
jgi:hexulose-6-phosphate isomerase